jgi:hypothetical protein
MNSKYSKFKYLIRNFSNSYFNLYHNITLEFEVCRLDQISNFHFTALLCLKKIGEENLFDKEEVLANSRKKLGRLINEIVLLQYQTKMNRSLLILFLEESNLLMEFLGSKEYEKTPE